MYYGEGGSIPFMGMLGEKFPKAQFLITGLLGPGSNAHGPNEFLHVPTGKNLTASVASVIAAQFAARRSLGDIQGPKICASVGRAGGTSLHASPVPRPAVFLV